MDPRPEVRPAYKRTCKDRTKPESDPVPCVRAFARVWSGLLENDPYIALLDEL